MFLGSSTDRFVLADDHSSESSCTLHVLDLELREWHSLGGLPAAVDSLSIQGHACSGSGNTIAVVVNDGDVRMLHVLSVDLDKLLIYNTRTFSSWSFGTYTNAELIPRFIGPSSSEFIVVQPCTGRVTYVGREHCGEMCFEPASATRVLCHLRLSEQHPNVHDDGDVDDDSVQELLELQWVEDVTCIGESRTVLWLCRSVFFWTVLGICLDTSRDQGEVVCKVVVPWIRGEATRISHDFEGGLTVKVEGCEDVQFPEVYGARTMRHQWMAACVRASQQATSDPKFAEMTT
jgi:hypothetical protein